MFPPFAPSTTIDTQASSARTQAVGWLQLLHGTACACQPYQLARQRVIDVGVQYQAGVDACCLSAGLQCALQRLRCAWQARHALLDQARSLITHARRSHGGRQHPVQPLQQGLGMPDGVEVYVRQCVWGWEG